MKSFSLSLLLALIIGQTAAFVASPNKAAVKTEESSTSLAYGYGAFTTMVHDTPLVLTRL
jgi:hypothetical protein